jgi:hypothetical protein
MYAILARIAAVTFQSPIGGLTTWASAPSLKLRLWADVAADQQPAAFLVTHRELDEYRGLGLLRRRLDLGIWCYSRSDNSIGQTDLDSMMAGFEEQFGADAVDDYSTNQLTLGGLVYWCRIEGKVFKDPGDIDGQTLLIVPLSVEWP